MPFTFKKIEEFSGLTIVKPAVFEDDRGFFMETFSFREFSKIGLKNNFVQNNHTKSVRGVLRGLHYQLEPMAQTKLVRCIEGEIFDVVVDIRRGSPSYGRWFGIGLSETNKKMLYIPRGFAHGFAVLSEEAQVIYMVDKHYSPEHDKGILWSDPDLGIEWPLNQPTLSEKDKVHPKFSESEVNFFYEGAE